MNVVSILLEVSVYTVLIFVCILIFKRVFKDKLSPHLNYGIWALLFLRLLVPVTFESNLPLISIPQIEIRQYLTLIGSAPQKDSVRQAGAEMTHISLAKDSTAQNNENSGPPHSGAQAYTPAQPVDSATAENVPAAIVSAAKQFSPADWLIVLWLIGVCFMSLRIFITYRRFQHRMKVSFVPCLGEKYELLEQVKQELGIKRRISLSYHSGLYTPALKFPSTILMPADLPMSQEQTKMALHHELTHYKRGDHIASIIRVGILAVYWFNPIVWIAFRKARNDMEAACDNDVVKTLGAADRHTYASTLLLLFAAPKKEGMLLGMAPGTTRKRARERLYGVFADQKSKWLPRLAALLLIPALLTGCFTRAPTPPNPMEEISDKLVLYMSPYRAWTLEPLVDTFKSMYPDVEVDVREFGDMFDPGSYEHYMAAIRADLMTGAGPDIVLLSDELDPYKAMEAGVFYDLNSFIDNDNEDGALNLSDYNQAVLDAGVYNGKRYLMPVSYTFPGIITTGESLRANALPPSGDLTFDEYLDALKSFADANNTTPFTQQNKQLHPFLDWSGLELIDNDSRRVNRDAIRSEAFRKIIDTYKSYYAYDFIEDDYLNDDANVLARQERLFTPGYSDSPNGFFMDYSMIYHESSPVVSAIKSVDGNVVAQVKDFAVISANSPNKVNAWRFLKVLLSDQYQVSSDRCYYFPVLKGALEKRFEGNMSPNIAFSSQQYNNGEPIGWEYFAPLDEFDSFYRLAGGVNSAVLNRAQTHEFLWYSMIPYLEGNKDYETCLAEFENRLELYVSE